MFYDEKEISDLLKCSYCQQKYTDVVKNLPCGNSICGKCESDLKQAQQAPEGSTEFTCKSCNGSHKALDETGLPNCVPLMKLVGKKPSEIYRGRDVESLKRILNELKTSNAEFKIELKDAKTKVTHYCNRLREDVSKSSDKAIEHINEIKKRLMIQIEDYEKGLMDKVEHPRKDGKLVTMKEDWEKLATRIDEFDQKWLTYIQQLVLDDSEISHANRRAQDWRSDLNKARDTLTDEVFQHKILKYEANQKFFDTENQFGNLRLSSDKTKRNSERKLASEIKIVNTLKGHHHSVRALASLPSGDLASGSDDKTINIWAKTDEGSYKVARSLVGHSATIYALAVLPNNCLASCSVDHTIKIWNHVNGSLIKNIDGHSGVVYSILALPNGYLASCSYDQSIKIWNLADYTLKKKLVGHTSWVCSLGLLANSMLISGSGDGMIKSWDLNDWKMVKTFIGHSGPVRSLVALPNDQLASGSDDQKIFIWNAKTGILEKTLIDHLGSVTTLTVVSNDYLISGSHDFTVKIWRISDWLLMKNLAVNQSTCLTSGLVPIDGSPDLAGGFDDRTIKIWRVF